MSASKKLVPASPTTLTNPNIRSEATVAHRDRLLSDKDVAHRYQVGKQTVWRWARTSSSFPKPIKVEGTTRWSELELDAHDRALKAARR